MGFAENLLKGSVATDQDSRLSWNEHTRSSVKFAGEDLEGSDASDDEVCIGALRRTLVANYNAKQWNTIMILKFYTVAIVNL